MGLGPRRASLVFNWMVDNADTISVSNNTMLGAPLPKRGKEPPDRSALQLRLFALEGLGGLVGGGQLATETREQTFTKLLSYATGKENEPFYEGAATGLGRTRDPRAVEPLRRLTKDSRPEIRRAAQNGLAAGFHDEAAIKALRSELGDHDPEAQLRAALVLLEINDETAIRWAIETVSQRRSSDSNQPDIRPEVVRGITVLGGPNARQELEQALSAGPGNDWLEAWIRVALLEMGDLSQMASVESALDKEDWSLDPRGFRSIWRSIQPLIMAAAQMALSSGMAAPTALQQIERAIQVIGNFAEGERARYLANADRRKAAIAQLRWQTADALGAAQPPGAAKILIRLLDDSAPVVRLSAAHALAVLHSPDSLDGIVSAFGREYGEEGGVSRNAEVYGALLRAALIQFPEDPRTRKLLEEAKEDKDPGVRFIGLTGLRPAS
ncbi:MAG: HEAT repeat domain-containing protein [Terriglobia bacterium]